MECKYFAELDSESPTIRNLQLAFWHAARLQFENIKSQFEREARRLEEDSDWKDDWDYAPRFLEDAAVAVVLAGTSVSQLLGQNTEARGNRMPAPAEALDQLLTNPHPQRTANISPTIREDFEEFISLYDALRHFGEPKHELVRQLELTELEPRQLRKHLQTTQEIWRLVLQLQGQTPGEEFQQDFDLQPLEPRP